MPATNSTNCSARSSGSGASIDPRASWRRSKRCDQLQTGPAELADLAGLDEQAEFVGSDPFPHDPLAVEVHDGHHPLVHCPLRRGQSGISACVGAPEGGSENHGVAGVDQLLDFDVEVRERFVVAADRFDPCRRSSPERVDMRSCVEVAGGLMVPPVPDFLDEGANPISRSTTAIVRTLGGTTYHREGRASWRTNLGPIRTPRDQCCVEVGQCWGHRRQ